MLPRLVPFEQRLRCKFNKARYCSLEQEPTPVTDSITKITVGAVGNYPALNRNPSLLRNLDIKHRIFKILSQNLSPFRITTLLTLIRSFSFEMYFNIYLSSKVNDSREINNKKAAPLQARRGPEGSRKLRFPDFVTTAQDGGKVVSLTHRPPLPPVNTPSTHFC